MPNLEAGNVLWLLLDEQWVLGFVLMVWRFLGSKGEQAFAATPVWGVRSFRVARLEKLKTLGLSEAVIFHVCK